MKWKEIKEATLEGVPEDRKEEMSKELEVIKYKIDNETS
jgi:hypothetical protein